VCHDLRSLAHGAQFGHSRLSRSLLTKRTASASRKAGSSSAPSISAITSAGGCRNSAILASDNIPQKPRVKMRSTSLRGTRTEPPSLTVLIRPNFA